VVNTCALGVCPIVSRCIQVEWRRTLVPLSIHMLMRPSCTPIQLKIGRDPFIKTRTMMYLDFSDVSFPFTSDSHSFRSASSARPSPMTPRIVNVGIIGCGEAAQVLHIPVLNQLSMQFRINFLCSSSPEALESCSRRVLNHVPQTTSEAARLCASPDVDVVFVLSSDELHPRHCLLALESHKHVFVEKPLAMSLSDNSAIVEAEKLSRGRVFVGYMRRYAAGFEEIREEVKQLGPILYARVRGIVYVGVPSIHAMLTLRWKRHHRPQFNICRTVIDVSPTVPRLPTRGNAGESSTFQKDIATGIGSRVQSRHDADPHRTVPKPVRSWIA
jgi:hypothetical protein